MKNYNSIQLEFVEFIPIDIEDFKLFVSMKYKITAHKCACGCGNIVYTPLNKKNGWTLYYDGDNISLYPSIGNFEFLCKSHYYITNNEIVWVHHKYETTRKSKFCFKNTSKVKKR